MPITISSQQEVPDFGELFVIERKFFAHFEVNLRNIYTLELQNISRSCGFDTGCLYACLQSPRTMKGLIKKLNRRKIERELQGMARHPKSPCVTIEERCRDAKISLNAYAYQFLIDIINTTDLNQKCKWYNEPFRCTSRTQEYRDCALTNITKESVVPPRILDELLRGAISQPSA